MMRYSGEWVPDIGSGETGIIDVVERIQSDAFAAGWAAAIEAAANHILACDGSEFGIRNLKPPRNESET